MAEHLRRGCTCKRCEARRRYERERLRDPGLRARAREATKRWRESERGREYHRAYKQREDCRTQSRAYERSERGREVHRAAKARYDASPKGSEARRRQDAARRSREADREKLAARKAVNKAIRAGKLTRPETCRCGRPSPLEAHHHRGYAREHRLDVVFLCRDCHRQEDA